VTFAPFLLRRLLDDFVTLDRHRQPPGGAPDPLARQHRRRHQTRRQHTHNHFVAAEALRRRHHTVGDAQLMLKLFERIGHGHAIGVAFRDDRRASLAQ